MENALRKYHDVYNGVPTISKETYKAINQVFQQPTTQLLLFLVTLSRSYREGKQGIDGILFTRSMLAHLLNKRPDKVRLTDFLQNMKILLPDLRWSSYSYSEGLATMITHTGIEDLLHRLGTDTSRERITIETIKKATPKAKAMIAKRLQELALQVTWPYEHMEICAVYLNSIPYKLFLDFNINAALVVAMKRDALLGEGRHDNVSQLIAFLDMCKPFYLPQDTSESKTSRIFAQVLQNMPSETRRALYPDWIDIDIQHCYLSILSGLFTTPITKKFLASGKNFWIDAMHHMGIASEQHNIAKEALKTAFYSIVFGKDKDKAQKILEREYALLGIAFEKPCFTHHVIEEIAQVVVDAKVDIMLHKGMDSAHGFIHQGNDSVDSILACAVQSYETACMSACFALATRERDARNSDNTIMLFQHDGFSLVPTPSASLDAILKRYQKAIASEGQKYHMDIRLEMTMN